MYKPHLFDKPYIKECCAILTLFLLTVIFFHNVIFSWDNQVLSAPETDLRHQLFYWRYFAFNTLRDGEIPLWNPYIFSGMPFLAGMQSAVFYPFNLIFVLLPIDIAINYSIALHVFLSGVFTFYLSRCLKLDRFSAMISAIIFMFCAPQILHIYPGHLPNLCTMVWLPLILLMLEMAIQHKRIIYALLGGVAVAFQILAGHPQYFFYSSIAVAIYFMARIIPELRDPHPGFRQAWKAGLFYPALFLIIFLSGFLLSAIQLIPAMEMVGYSTRKDIAYEFVSMFSFPPENLITFLVPGFFGDLLTVPYWGRCYLWEMSAYIGILPLVLIAVAISFKRDKYTIAFVSISIICLILAFGKYTPLLRLLYDYVPGFDKFRGNSKFIFIVTFSMAMLAGFGCNAVVKNKSSIARRKLNRFYWIFLAAVITVSAICISFIFITNSAEDSMWKAVLERSYGLGDRFEPASPGISDTEFVKGSRLCAIKNIIRFIILLASTAIIIVLWIKKNPGQRIIKALIFSLIFIDLWLYGTRYMKTFDIKECLWDEDMVKFLQDRPEPFRIISLGRTAINQGMAHGIQSIAGYDANILEVYSDFINVSENAPMELTQFYMEVKRLTGLTDLLNLKYIIVDSETALNHPVLRLIFDNGNYKIYENLKAMPRAFIVEEGKVLAERDMIFKELRSDSFAPAQYAILEEAPAVLPEPLEDIPILESPTKIVEYGVNKVLVDASLKKPGLLVLGDIYYPGWNVYVDGTKDKIYKTDYCLRGVLLNSGSHKVEFVYEPLSFKIGVLITLSYLLFLLSFIMYKLVRGFGVSSAERLNRSAERSTERSTELTPKPRTSIKSM